MHRRGTVTLLTLLALLAPQASGQAPPCPEGGAPAAASPRADCPPPVPRPEIPPGWNLYWHDPCDCYSDPCLEPTCPVHQNPTWYVTGELLPLFRDQSDSRFQASGEGLSDSVFRTEYEAGARVLIGRAIGDWYRLEASYFGSYHWDDVEEFEGSDVTEELGFSSELDNIELNLRRRLYVPAYRRYERYSPLRPPGSPIFLNHRASASCLVGMRYLRIEEQLGNSSGADVENGIEGLLTDNYLIGAQVGILSQFLVYHRSWIDFDVKGGIFTNRVSLTGLDTATELDQHDRTSFLGDLSLIYNHQITPALTFRVGYNAIWVSGVALASRNVGQTLVQHDGDVVYHGPSLGLTCAW
jgi:hypothetical protein